MRNILLAVMGLSPQILTETLYALHQNGRNVDEIQVITTRKGKDIINATLLSPRDGKYYRYLAEYGFDPGSISFGFDNVHTVSDSQGREIEDIGCEEENELLMQRCLEMTFHLTKNPEVAVFFSIAGGRKTMSACLMTAAQMYARPQDRVYHVLVSPEFESSPEFFYPPADNTMIQLTDNKGQPYSKDTRYAAVSLIHVPFVTIRNQLSSSLLKIPKDPATLILSLVHEEKANLVVDIPNAKLIYKGREIDMMPARFALYAFFAMQKKNCLKGNSSCRACDDCFLGMEGITKRQTEISDLYARITKDRIKDSQTRSGIDMLDYEGIRSYRSKINNDILKGFGSYAKGLISIESIGKKPDTRYGLCIDRGRIRIVL